MTTVENSFFFCFNRAMDEIDSLKPTIGLEVHVELKTQTKMFCACLNDSQERHPNVNICAICAGHPGTLPTINKKAVEYVLKLGMALGGKVFPAKQSKFDRKNYFYPDLPKGYQISQYDQPLVEGGELLGVRLRRIHLEEDAGRLTHTKDGSLIDYNRAGVPLMELVTEPDIKDSKQATAFSKELQLILRYLDISDADMEKGQLRLEANVSLSMGTKVEVKNINSFRALGDAIDYELRRQRELLEKNGRVVHETRGWDDDKKETVSQRGKEEAHDYRYFPEPDLPPFDSKAFKINQIKAEVVELPEAKRRRFASEFNLDEKQVEVLVQDRAIADYFEEAVSELEKPNQISLLYNYFTTDLWGLLKKEEVDIRYSRVTPEFLSHIIDLIDSKKITSRIAKDLLAEVQKTGLDPHEIIANEEWQSVSDDDSLRPLAEKILNNNPKQVQSYKQGKENLIQFFIGSAMAELKGKADPYRLREIFENLLKGGGE